MHTGFYVTGSATGGYRELLDQVVQADASGFDSVWLRERHFHRDHQGRNFFSAPMVVAAWIAARTERVRIGLGARILPLDHPLHIAEDAATIDDISGGRLDLGLGRGQEKREPPAGSVLEGRVADADEVDRRPGLLHGHRQHRHLGNLEVLARERERLARPGALDHLERLGEPCARIGGVEPEITPALASFIREAQGKPKRIFCTYTAMLAIRRELSKITTVEVVS